MRITAGLISAFYHVGDLYQKNALHRKGFRLQELSDEQMLDHAADELQELRDEPADLDEFADLLAVLFNYAWKHGWSVVDIGTAMLRKLAIRFTVED